MSEILSLYGHPITNIDVIGTVTCLESFAEKFAFSIDDSTASLPCVIWSNDIGWSLHRDTLTHLDQTMNKIQLGDIVRVRGKLRILPFNLYGSSMELSVFSINLEQDPNIELLHRLEVMSLDQVYQVPFELPSQLVAAVTPSEPTLEELISSFLGIHHIITKTELRKLNWATTHLPLPRPPFSVNDILQDDQIAQFLQQITDDEEFDPTNSAQIGIEQVLFNIHQQGHIIHDPSGRCVSFVQSLAEDLNMGRESTIFDDSFQPSPDRPWLILSSEILAPVVLNAIQHEYAAKISDWASNSSRQITYGCSLNKCVEHVKSTGVVGLENVGLVQVKKTIQSLIEHDLVYETTKEEFRPVIPFTYISDDV